MMSAAVAVAEPCTPAAPEPEDTGARTRRWTRVDYYRAAELRLFRPDERLELLEGEVGDSDPEPGVAVIAGTIRDYESGHPTAASVLLLVEVSDTTLLLDRRRKAAAYAAAGIREYWILNLRDRRLEVHRDPAGGVYQTIISLGATQTISPLGVPQPVIGVADLLPSAA